MTARTLRTPETKRGQPRITMRPVMFKVARAVSRHASARAGFVVATPQPMTVSAPSQILKPAPFSFMRKNRYRPGDDYRVQQGAEEHP